jgi:acetylornithine deacetylase/succinyl-diaminopimelate desuccinylase-like protein
MTSRNYLPMLAAVICFVTALPAQQPLDANAQHDEALHFLTELVKLDTSNPPGNEIRAANYIKSVLDKEGIASEIFESAPGRANLVARLKGNGSKKPLLLMGHIDVVGVERDKWTVDPFSAMTKDGYLYGRGSSDDKAMDAANLEVFLQLHRQKTPLDRDVILLAEAGEEGTSQFGIDFMVAQHWDKIDCEYALNEGGSFHLSPDGKIEYAGVSPAEKVPRGLLLVGQGSSGHGSIPRADNVITHLGAAVGKVGSWQAPMRLNDVSREYFERLAKISSKDDAYLYTHLDQWDVQEKIRLTHPPQSSMLRTSIVPTIIKGGFRENVIPSDAEATLDVRALPDEDMDALIAKLNELINDPQIEIKRLGEGQKRPTTTPSSIHNEMFSALEHAQAKIFPGAVTLPLMQTGATDSAQLRAKGVQAYGIGIPHTDDDARRVHGNDERVSIDALGKFVDYLNSAVFEVAAKKQ